MRNVNGTTQTVPTCAYAQVLLRAMVIAYTNKLGKQPGDGSHALTAEQKVRRKEQNRAAQRAFRERKERYVKELETKIKFLEDTHTTSLQAVHQENEDLRNVIKRMESELLAVKGAAASFNEQLNRLREQGMDVPTFTLPEPMDSDNDEENEPPAAKRIMRVAPSAVACIRDKDGVSFCERLKEEVCSSAYDQLLSEPLFDSSGVLNDAVTQRPVPIVTGMEESKTSMRHDIDRFMDTMVDRTILDPAMHETKLLPCNEVWSRLSEHPHFEQFDLDLLCDELKRKAKCSHDGTVLEEEELSEVLRKMEASLAGPER
ncbi:hypothetical protein BJV82DRAFT_613360 [Fennellomyces sp. T-0311]|nr:hypothetical protein BJV82DRAFT_613360 [Fennellomyces sp. T-0311]